MEEQREERLGQAARTSGTEPAGRRRRGPTPAGEAVEVDEGFLGVGGGVRISATTPEFCPNFFRLLWPIIQLRLKISHSHHRVSLRRS
jgi:hypothetical protein